MTIRQLTHEDIVEQARRAAEDRLPLHTAHHFDPGSTPAVKFELAYRQRQVELDAAEG